MRNPLSCPFSRRRSKRIFPGGTSRSTPWRSSSIRTIGSVLDPYGGQRDLHARMIWVLHAGSFQDDPTRIFRAIPFEQRFDFRLERTTVGLLAQALHDLIKESPPLDCRTESFCCSPTRPGARDCADGAVEAASLSPPPSVLHEKCQASGCCRSKALAWWVHRFRSVLDRPIVYLMALSSESSPACAGRDDPAISAFT